MQARLAFLGLVAFVLEAALRQFAGAIEDRIGRLSWSVVGNVLAVSDANNQVSVWKESVDGKWTRIQSK